MQNPEQKLNARLEKAQIEFYDKLKTQLAGKKFSVQFQGLGETSIMARDILVDRLEGGVGGDVFYYDQTDEENKVDPKKHGQKVSFWNFICMPKIYEVAQFELEKLQIESGIKKEISKKFYKKERF